MPRIHRFPVFLIIIVATFIIIIIVVVMASLLLVDHCSCFINILIPSLMAYAVEEYQENSFKC